MPAMKVPNDPQGIIITKWQLSPEELERVKETGTIHLSMLTFNQPLQPVLIRIAPDIISAYAPINNPTNPTGVQIIFPNGRYLEIKTTQQEQQRVIATLDKLKEPTTV